MYIIEETFYAALAQSSRTLLRKINPKCQNHFCRIGGHATGFRTGIKKQCSMWLVHAATMLGVKVERWSSLLLGSQRIPVEPNYRSRCLAPIVTSQGYEHRPPFLDWNGSGTITLMMLLEG